MKIAVISDLHLGYRQYGLLEREEDFYIQYLECMRQIEQNEVDCVIIAGDIFDKPNPSPEAMNVYRKGVLSLGGIPVYAITGNHTMLMRDNHYTVDSYFAESGIDNYYLIDDSIHFEEGFDICGIAYRTDTKLDEFKEALNDVTSCQKEKNFHVLVIHQAVKEYCGFTGAELSIKDFDLNSYDLIICGHIHSRHETLLGNGKTIFLQPGSPERMNTTEARDEINQGKGFYIFDTQTRDLLFHPIDSPRKFLLGDIQFESKEDIDNHFKQLQEQIQQMSFYPIISYDYYDNTGHSVYIRDLIKKVDGCLINNSNIYDLTEELPSIEVLDNELPTVLEVIDLKMSDSYDEKSIKFAQEIFKAYDNNKEEDVKTLLDSFFKENFNEEEIVDEKRFDEMEKELKEYEDFFNNLGEI